MKYLIFDPAGKDMNIYFASVSTHHYVGRLVLQPDGDHYFMPSGKHGIIPDYLLREIIEKLEELNKYNKQ